MIQKSSTEFTHILVWFINKISKKSQILQVLKEPPIIFILQKQTII